MCRVAFLLFGVLAGSVSMDLRASQVQVPFVRVDREGALTVQKDAKGDAIPDFSSAGYGGGGIALPTAEARVVVSPTDGDDGARIQAALDHVASLPVDSSGLRGAVVLTRGRFEIAGALHLRASGVVLRGAGSGESDTVLIATGTDRRALIQIAGEDDRRKIGSDIAIADNYVPVGATSFSVANVNGLAVGDRVVIERPSTREWIEAIGMHDAPGRQPFAWKPGAMNLTWDRTITRIDGNRVTVDAPLTTALDRTFGGGTISSYSWPGRISQVGVENLRCLSELDPRNPKDEEHAWMAVTLDRVENAWVANVTAVHFVSSAVHVAAGARTVTVQDCSSLAPVSELGGYRRHSFHTSGQLTLFQRCTAEEGIHDFTVGYLASGPNVFLECTAARARGFSGSIGSWASGALFDNVTIDGSSLELDNRETWNQGVGWAAANSVLYQCSAAIITCRRPPTANNWAIGPWAEFRGDGWWDQVNEFVRPTSLYRAQLAQRRSPEAVAALQPRSTLPAPNEAPALENVVPDLAKRLAPVPTPSGKPLALVNGWLTANGEILVGTQAPTNWWRGTMLPSRLSEYQWALTRFAPGRSGRGATDDLDELATLMVCDNQVALRHHYGLWYDRRRDDHERVRRADGDAWPPFFEQPFARSGQGEAWDRLSRYDLTRYNPWYFGRLREFAGQARHHGLVLVNEMYFQHNILEAGAHWADSPWRPANALQPTGFPEPPPYVESDGSEPDVPGQGKRIFVASDFYDVSHPMRRELHRAYIRQCLANLADQPNVIHTLTAENSGPLHFMEFWLDVIAEWQTETGRNPLIALSAPKDVQDAILADAKRSALVDVIDFTYWFRTDSGEEFAPAGGTQWAPRQHLRLWKGGKPSPASIAGMVREYRDRYPEKAVISSLGEADGWLFAAAGGSLAKLPSTLDPSLRAAIARMQPLPSAATAERAWALGQVGREYLIASSAGRDVRLDLRAASGKFAAHRIDAKTGRIGDLLESIEGGHELRLPASPDATTVFWIKRVSP